MSLHRYFLHLFLYLASTPLFGYTVSAFCEAVLHWWTFKLKKKFCFCTYEKEHNSRGLFWEGGDLAIFCFSAHKDCSVLISCPRIINDRNRNIDLQYMSGFSGLNKEIPTIDYRVPQIWVIWRNTVCLVPFHSLAQKEGQKDRPPRKVQTSLSWEQILGQKDTHLPLKLIFRDGLV